MASTSAFSSAGEDAIARTIDVTANYTADDSKRSPEDFDSFYEIETTAEEIRRNVWKRTALQFPDELLHDSVPIYKALKRRVEEDQELYVLADTSYGSCCVDEVAAQHVDANAVVHYGHACLSITNRLPVIYVYGRKPLDVVACTGKFREALESSNSANEGEAPTLHNERIQLRLDVSYAHIGDRLFQALQKTLSRPVTYTPIPTRTQPTSVPLTVPDPPVPLDESTVDQPRQVDDRTPADIILYVGPESLALTNLLLTHSSKSVYSYDPGMPTQPATLASARTNRLLMRRYAALQRARDADVFGLLVGTLGVASYLPLLASLRDLLKRAHKKTYTISVGKLNPAKLANFPEIECWVLVACKENSMVDSKEYYKPIVTPFELQTSLNSAQEWSGRYVLDFETVIREVDAGKQEGEQKQEEDSDEDDLDRPHFSLITGKYHHAKRYGVSESEKQVEPDADPQSVLLRNRDGTVVKLVDFAAGNFLQGRHYQGLEARVGMDAPGVLEQGRSGVARGYADDHT